MVYESKPLAGRSCGCHSPLARHVEIHELPGVVLHLARWSLWEARRGSGPAPRGPGGGGPRSAPGPPGALPWCSPTPPGPPGPGSQPRAAPPGTPEPSGCRPRPAAAAIPRARCCGKEGAAPRKRKGVRGKGGGGLPGGAVTSAVLWE